MPRKKTAPERHVQTGPGSLPITPALCRSLIKFYAGSAKTAQEKRDWGKYASMMREHDRWSGTLEQLSNPQQLAIPEAPSE